MLSSPRTHADASLPSSPMTDAPGRLCPVAVQGFRTGRPPRCPRARSGGGWSETEAKRERVARHARCGGREPGPFYTRLGCFSLVHNTPHLSHKAAQTAMASSTPFLLLLVLLFAATPALSSPQPPRCAPGDLHALLAVKQSLGNPRTLSTWSPASPDCCRWDHVRCDEAGRVNNVFIDGAGDVHGQIPSAVAGLTALMSLSLFRLPGLSGTIPPCLTSLSNLQFLTISHTNVSGPIPEHLTRIRSLDSVDLSNNRLTGCIPRSFADLPNLRSLDLRHNQLTGPIPAGLVQGQFRSLILSYNQLSGPIPRDDARDEINTVDLSHNRLTGDASHLFVPGRPIGKVDLSWNDLDFDLTKAVFPPELTYLDLSHNRIHGTVPASLGRLSTLQKLDLSYNHLCGPLPRYHGVMKHGCQPYEHNQCLRGSPIETCRRL